MLPRSRLHWRTNGRHQHKSSNVQIAPNSLPTLIMHRLPIRGTMDRLVVDSTRNCTSSHRLPRESYICIRARNVLQFFFISRSYDLVNFFLDNAKKVRELDLEYVANCSRKFILEVTNYIQNFYKVSINKCHYGLFKFISLAETFPRLVFISVLKRISALQSRKLFKISKLSCVPV